MKGALFGVLLAVGVASYAMPSEQALSEVQKVVEELTADDFAAKKDGSITSGQLADRLLKYVDDSETEAAKFLLIRMAFQQCLEGFEYAKAVDAYSRFVGCVKDVPGRVLADWVVPYVASHAKRGRADGLAILLKKALDDGNMSSAVNIAQRIRGFRRTLSRSRHWEDLNVLLQRTASAEKVLKNHQQLEKAVKKNPTDPTLRMKYAYSFAAKGDWQGALKEFEKTSGKIAEVAAWENSYPNSTAAWTKAAVAEFWWSEAEACKQPELASACRLHAASWFRDAVDSGELTGLKKTLAEKRIAEASEQGVVSSVANNASAAGKPIVLALGKGVKIELLPCPAGEFTMGGVCAKIPERQCVFTPHKVKISRQFWVSKYLVTREQWNALMPKVEMDDFEKALGGEKAAVTRVSPDEVHDFCVLLDKKFRRFVPSGYVVRLPTEAEWEYAYRADSKPDEPYGKAVFDSKEEGFQIGVRGMAKLGIIKNKMPQIDISKLNVWDLPGCLVGTKKPNPWGLYDMAGNVGQLCFDRVPFDRPDGSKQMRHLHVDCRLEYKDAVDPLFWSDAKRYCAIGRGGLFWRFGWQGEKLAIPGIVKGRSSGFRIAIAPDLVKERRLKYGER